MSQIYIKNTVSKEKEEFHPLQEGRVLFYHCGPTVYWTQHIGNLRGMTCGDLIIRSLRYLGYEVVHVRNYTDVGHLTSDDDEGEDKIEKSARKEEKDPKEIADTFIDKFERDVAALNLAEPTHKPRATEHISDMQDLIQTLLDKGYAYTTDWAVYFDITQFEDYGKLSGQDPEEKMTGAGTGEVSDPQKRHPQDFALWFFKAGVHRNALQTWESPFTSPQVENGRGFPGWHIECSAMSKRYLGDTIDIHMGGIEHVPVHHTNEIAQSEAANGVKFVNYWVHNEHLLVNEGKMAKSEGTGITLDDVVEKIGDPMVLRFFFLQAHYRSKQNFTEESIENAKNEFESFRNRIREISMQAGGEMGEINSEYQNKFVQVLADDFNIPEALAIVTEMLKSDIAPQDKLVTLKEFDQVLGLEVERNMVAMEKVTQEDIQVQIEKGIPEDIQKKMADREKFRQNKQFQEADDLRDEIEKEGYVIEDSKEGPRIFKK